MMKKVLAVLVVSLLVPSAVSMPLEAGEGVAVTNQYWTFSTAGNGPYNIAPDNPEGNPYGTASASIDVPPGGDVAWNEGQWWEAPTFSLVIEIDNNPLPNAYKKIWIDIEYRGEFDDTLKYIETSDFDEFARLDDESWIAPIEGRSGWFRAHEVWYIEPNPDWERICFGFDGVGGEWAAISFVEVTTWCVPEPATLVMLGLGSLVLLKRRH